MASVYRSRIDTWLVVLVAAVVVACLHTSADALLGGATSAWWIPVLVVTLGVGLPLWLLFGTNYRLETGQLRISSGPFRWRIPVEAITSITATSNPLASPALSLKRLRIDYGGDKMVMISPRNEEMFLRDIEEIRRVSAKAAFQKPHP